MTLALFVLAAVGVVNAPRSRTAVTGGWRVAGIGAALALLALVPFAAFAAPLLDTVSMSAATVRLATGLLLVATGLLAFGGPGPAPEPALAGRRAALVPVAFPTLLTPGLAALTIVGSVDHSAPVSLGVVTLALATLPAVTVAALPGDRVRTRVLDGSARALAGLLVLAGFALLMDGVFDV